MNEKVENFLEKEPLFYNDKRALMAAITEYMSQYASDGEQWIAEDGFIKGYEYRNPEVEDLCDKWFRWDVKCCELKMKNDELKASNDELVNTLYDLITSHCVTSCSNRDKAVEVLKKYVPEIVIKDE